MSIEALQKFAKDNKHKMRRRLLQLYDSVIRNNQDKLTTINLNFIDLSGDNIEYLIKLLPYLSHIV